jgi:excisionase family DNA binding protein
MKCENRKRRAGQGRRLRLSIHKSDMGHTIHDKLLSAKLDALFDVGRDFAQTLLTRWLESRANDQAEASGRSAAETSPATSSNNDEPLLTAGELAKHIKLSAPTIRDWSRKGRIPFEPVGRERRYRLSVINKWIDDNKLNLSSPARDNGVESSRSFLRPAIKGAKSNGI